MPAQQPERIAVVMFNLGGPDTAADVGPFLKNLFNDPAIIRAPQPFRWFIANSIVRSRLPVALKNYAQMNANGGSPLLAETQQQAQALTMMPKLSNGPEIRCFIAMRYWSPYIVDVVGEVEAWGPDRTVLLPLYPQFSTTTTGSSLAAWRKAGGDPNAKLVCCYPTETNFIKAHAERLKETWEKAGKPGNIRLLLSAHGLPERVVAGGDPYQWQVEQTVAALKPLLPPEWEVDLCYQSRVGPLKWIGPSTDERVEAAARDGKAILVCPIAFVSDHIETLVELGMEYRHLAEAAGAKTYLLAPALTVAPHFVQAMYDMVLAAAADDQSVRSHCGGRICPVKWRACPNHRPPANQPLVTDPKA